MTVYIRKNESFENALNRFHKRVKKEGIIEEYCSRMAFKSKKQRQRAEARERDKKRTKNQKSALDA